MPDTRSAIFNRLQVANHITGGAVITWELDPHFLDPLQHTYQLQFSNCGGEYTPDGEWTDIGAPADNVAYLIDPEQRVFGKDLSVAYRVKLTTRVDVYYSQPVYPEGLLDTRNLYLARELVRKEKLRHNLATIEVWILKRKRCGSPCPNACSVDRMTGLVKNSQCIECHGTGIVDGYYAGILGEYADITPEQRYTHRDNSKARGTIEDIVQSARFVGFPKLDTEDIIVEKYSDQRWYVHRIMTKAEIRGIPVICDVELRKAPYTDMAYKIPLEGN